MTNSLEYIFKLDFSENFSQQEKNNSINGLNCFIIKHISLLNSFKVDDKIYYKISLPKDLVVERRKVLGRGSWNVASEGIVFKGNDKLKENSEVVLRTFWNDTNLYTIRNNFKQTKLSFFDNIIVNDNDEIIRKNRLELLQMFCRTFENYINFSKIESA